LVEGLIELMSFSVRAGVLDAAGRNPQQRSQKADLFIFYLLVKRPGDT
jgi:hypothetical protein